MRQVHKYDSVLDGNRQEVLLALHGPVQKVSLPNVTRFIRIKVTGAGQSLDVSDSLAPCTSSVNNERGHLRLPFLVLGDPQRPEYSFYSSASVSSTNLLPTMSDRKCYNADLKVHLCGKYLQHLRACRRGRD